MKKQSRLSLKILEKLKQLPWRLSTFAAVTIDTGLRTLYVLTQRHVEAKAIFLTFEGCKNTELFRVSAVFTCSATRTDFTGMLCFHSGVNFGGQDDKLAEKERQGKE